MKVLIASCIGLGLFALFVKAKSREATTRVKEIDQSYDEAYGVG